MIIIYKNLISKYINLLSVDHIRLYAKNNNIDLLDEEVLVIYNFIMNNYLKLIEDDDTIYLLKPYLRENIFDKVLSIYKENKIKYL